MRSGSCWLFQNLTPSPFQSQIMPMAVISKVCVCTALTVASAVGTGVQGRPHATSSCQQLSGSAVMQLPGEVLLHVFLWMWDGWANCLTVCQYWKSLLLSTHFWRTMYHSVYQRQPCLGPLFAPMDEPRAKILATLPADHLPPPKPFEYSEGSLGHAPPPYCLQLLVTPATGIGVYTLDAVPQGAVVCEFVCDVTPREREGWFGDMFEIFLDCLEEDRVFYLRCSAVQRGNLSRFIRFSQQQPNLRLSVEFQADRTAPRLSVVALQDIAPFTELLWDDFHLVPSERVRRAAAEESQDVRDALTNPGVQRMLMLVAQARALKRQGKAGAGIHAIYAF